MKLPLFLTLIIMAASSSLRADDAPTIPLWPEGTITAPPGDKDTIQNRGPTGKPDRFIKPSATPTLTVYFPPAEKNTGAAVIICPGGGYGGQAIDKEGHDIAHWLNTVGVTGIVLKYRLPKPQVTKEGTPLPLLDAQRAIRLARSRATEWKINPDRIGIMGFSAGGHLASMAATHCEKGISDAKDPLDRLSSRPDFLILIYPVITLKAPIAHSGSAQNLLGKKPSAKLIDFYSSELQVTKQTPPNFLVQTKDDMVSVKNSILFHEACKKAAVPSELQLYEKGGHGYGMGVHGGDVATWPQRCKEWMNKSGWLKQ